MFICCFTNYNVSSNYQPIEESLGRQGLTKSKVVVRYINN